MTHAYTVEIHTYISDKLTFAEEKTKTAEMENDLETVQFYKGQLAEIAYFRNYLSETIDLKTQQYY